ncbi:hypothetical protein LSTR_LSTR007033 [Laodelphax striatellus]|uniref:Uncharacterized protein n=1 Tax=Laodelphax striatellus TaxID=195883 RepID=A0A482WJF3_LAOST|nr:hypothetical protein LSTR_LSTR016152 [Laodelphax striatellus]RZF33655.1 hypothetical protein LSTR_LSTR007033 [Laodelphax striatellus]
MLLSAVEAVSLISSQHCHYLHLTHHPVTSHHETQPIGVKSRITPKNASFTPKRTPKHCESGIGRSKNLGGAIHTVSLTLDRQGRGSLRISGYFGLFSSNLV